MRRRTDLDGLRGIAVLLVVLCHWRLVPGGLYGVDAFFVLSGYLITGQLLAGQSTGTFYRRRARRLLPPLLFTFAVVAVLRPVATGEPLRLGMLAGLFYVANLVPAVTGLAPGVLGHLWSLSVEEQFYLAWPKVTRRWLLTGRHAARTLIGCAVFVEAGRLLLAVCVPDGARVYWEFTTPLRVDGLLLGAALAVMVARGQLPRVVMRRRVLLLGAALVATAIVGFSSTAAWPYDIPLIWGYTAASVGSALVVAHVVARPAPFLGWQPLATLGLVSYSVYLLHIPLLIWATNAGMTPPLADVFDALSTGLLAWFCWRGVESPEAWLRRARWPRRTGPRRRAVLVQQVLRPESE